MTPNAKLNTDTTRQIAVVRSASMTVISPFLSEARAVTVTDPESYQLADSFLFRIKSARKVIESKITPIKRPINEAKAAVMALEHELDDPLAAAEREVKAKMAAWQDKDRARVAEEDRKRQQEIDRKSREEANLVAEADRKRLEEARAAQESERARTEKERQEAWERAETARRETLKLEERQRQVAAEVDQLQQEAAEVEGPVEAAGSVVKKVHGWEVVDFHALVMAVGRGEVPEVVLAVNTEVINEFFSRDQAMTCRWPGLRHTLTTRIAQK